MSQKGSICANLICFDLETIKIGPAEACALLELQTPPRRMRLGRVLDRPVYFVLPRGEAWRAVYADDGALIERVDVAMAQEIASRYLEPRVKADYLGTVETIDQWTLTNSLNLHRPLHRFALRDEDGTEVYVSQRTGEVVMKSTRMERRLAWIGPIMHWIAPEFLRRHVGPWRQFLLWTSLAGTLLVVTGIIIGVLRYKRGGYAHRDAGRSFSPYRSWKRWHHWAGVVFGVTTLTWIFSGLLYLNPGGSRAHPLDTTTTFTPYNVGGLRANYASSTTQTEAFTGGALEPALFVRSAVAAAQAAPVEEVREVEMIRFAGVPYYVVYADWNRSYLVRADAVEAPARAFFSPEELLACARAAVPHGRLTEWTWLTEYDAYYYSVGAVAPKRLPILRVKFDDEARTWLYVDPHTGSIFRRYDARGRALRWLINGLHCLDFPFLFRHRPAWDLAIILLSAGGFLLSASAVVLSTKRIALVYARWRQARRLLRGEHAINQRERTV